MRKSFSQHVKTDKSNQSLDLSVADWEAKIGNKFQKIQLKDLPNLVTLLQNENDVDSYLTSWFYYAFTGRRGLWIHQENGAFVLFCWHPNIIGQILVFPPRGSLNQAITRNLLKQLPKPPAGLRLARVKQESNRLKLSDRLFDYAGNSMCLVPVIDHVMDWRYPVRVLSTEKLMNMHGADFHKIRNRVRQIERKCRNLRVEKLNLSMQPQLWNLINGLCGSFTNNLYEQNERINFYRKLLDLWSLQIGCLDGIACWINEEIKAFALWDISNANMQTANRYVNLCDLCYHGLADFLMHHTGKNLFSSEILNLNVGGSETASLDQFKNKFMPAYSVELCSVDVVYDEVVEDQDDFNFSISRQQVKYA